MTNLLAQVNTTIGNSLHGIGPLGLEGKSTSEGPAIFQMVLSNIIGVMTIIAIIWFVILVITGAIGIISSGGDKQALESSRKRIFSGLIGLVVLIAALFIIQLVGSLIGIPNILNLTELINNIKTQ